MVITGTVSNYYFFCIIKNISYLVSQIGIGLFTYWRIFYRGEESWLSHLELTQIWRGKQQRGSKYGR